MCINGIGYPYFPLFLKGKKLSFFSCGSFHMESVEKKDIFSDSFILLVSLDKPQCDVV